MLKLGNAVENDDCQNVQRNHSVGMNGLQLSAILFVVNETIIENPDVETGQCC